MQDITSGYNPQPEVCDLRTRIKSSTTLIHTKLDEVPIARQVMDSAVSPAHYQAFLEKTYGFVKPLEEALREIALPEQLQSLNLDQRTKVHLIEKDLRSIGISEQAVSELPTMKTLPEIKDFAQVMGVLYVLEGSTMGGLVISKHIAATLGYSAQNGSSFLNCYSSPRETVAMFQRFIGVLNSYAQSVPDAAGFPPCSAEIREREERTCGAAFDTFLAVDRWMSGATN